MNILTEKESRTIFISLAGAAGLWEELDSTEFLSRRFYLPSGFGAETWWQSFIALFGVPPFFLSVVMKSLRSSFIAGNFKLCL